MTDELTPADRESRFQAWVESRPPAIRDVIRKYPGERMGELVCYRSLQNPRMHYTIYSYSEAADGGPVTLVLVHGRNSTLPGVSTFGQPPEQLIECGCGEWSMPTEDQIAETRARLNAQSMRTYGRPLRDEVDE